MKDEPKIFKFNITRFHLILHYKKKTGFYLNSPGYKEWLSIVMQEKLSMVLFASFLPWL